MNRARRLPHSRGGVLSRGLDCSGPEHGSPIEFQTSKLGEATDVLRTCDPAKTGVQESLERWLEQWDEYGFEIERLIDCDDDVLLIAREHARGLRSGARVSSRIYCVLTLHSGKVVRYQEFYDEQTALKAVGLAE
jgi:ketosteroid isomerase-like protein